MRIDRTLVQTAAWALLLLAGAGPATAGAKAPDVARPTFVILAADSTQPTKAGSGGSGSGGLQGVGAGSSAEESGFGALAHTDEIVVERMLSDNRLVGATAAEAWLRAHPNAFSVFPAEKRTAALVLFMRKAAERSAASAPDPASASSGESPADATQSGGNGGGKGWAGVPASYQEGWDHPGHDYTSFPLPEANPKICWTQCIQDDRCVAWTYVKPGVQGPMAACWLKDGWPQPVASDCCTSGAKSDADRKTMSDEAKAAAEMEAMEQQMQTTEPGALEDGSDGSGDSGGYGSGSSSESGY